MDYGILSLAPAIIALALAFATKNALFSILIGVVVGVAITGKNLLFGFSDLMQNALGNADFIWILALEVFVGILVALFQKSGAIQHFRMSLEKKEPEAEGSTVSCVSAWYFHFLQRLLQPTLCRNCYERNYR